MNSSWGWNEIGKGKILKFKNSEESRGKMYGLRFFITLFSDSSVYELSDGLARRLVRDWNLNLVKAEVSKVVSSSDEFGWVEVGSK